MVQVWQETAAGLTGEEQGPSNILWELWFPPSFSEPEMLLHNTYVSIKECSGRLIEPTLKGQLCTRSRSEAFSSRYSPGQFIGHVFRRFLGGTIIRWKTGRLIHGFLAQFDVSYLFFLLLTTFYCFSETKTIKNWKHMAWWKRIRKSSLVCSIKQLSFCSFLYGFREQ